MAVLWQYSHEPHIAVARFWSLFDVEVGEGQRREKHELGHRALAALEQGLADRTFLVADRYTIADIALYAYTHVAGEGGFELQAYPSIRSWLQRIADQPGHIPITA